ncbi:hypothetical protein Vi05172_g1726 [Venturia inaequalis]|nr:hypothetical protein Vi05172_g1726 [Venturia inaequalis]
MNWKPEPDNSISASSARHIRRRRIEILLTAPYAARAYYYPIKTRPNLFVYLNSTAQRMTWSTGGNSSAAVADGVVFADQSGIETRLQATREVILSAGSLVSPRILELSGVGNPLVLKPLGIEVKVNSPFVGENLQDQTNSNNAYTSTQNFTNSGLGGFVGYFNAADVWGNNTAAFAATVKSSLEQYAKDTVQATGGTVDTATLIKLFTIQHDLIFKENVTIAEVIVSAPSGGSGAVSYWGLMPFSRGNIHIKSNNASVPASINPNYFMLDYDIAQQVGTAQMARKVATTAPLSNIFTAETAPGLSTVPAGDSGKAWEIG